MELIASRRFAAFTGLIRDRSRIGSLLCLIALCIMLFALIFVPLIAPHDPLLPAGEPFLSPSVHFLFGTDAVGRDIFSRVLYGIRSTITATVIVIGSGILIGNLIGVAAGMMGGWVDAILMRMTDAFLALPGPVLAIAVVGALGPSLEHTVIAVIVVWWPLYARIVRGEVRAFVVRPAFEAAKLAGISRTRLALRHLLPGTFPPIVIAASLDVALLILALASLSFLGLGSPAPAPELGAMSARGLPYLLQYWWVPIIPGLAIALISFLANFAGDAIRDLMIDR